MWLRRGWSAGVVALVAVAGAAVTGVAVAGTAAVPAGAQPPAGSGHTVILVTGDRVTLSGDGSRVSAQAGPGRSGVNFAVTRVRGHVQVVPDDAGPLLASGRLDPRLFDVTGLVAAGYERQDPLPLILAGGTRASTARVAPKAVTAVDGLTKVMDLPAVNGMAVRQPRGEATQSWRALTGGDRSARSLESNVDKVWLDGLRQPTLDVSVPQIGAPAAWAAGYTGVGTTVAVLDTGIDDTHPDLAGQVIGRRNFTEDTEPDADLSGHGTHVAATIASTGDGSGGRYKGVAPGAKLLDGKVCVVGGCAESWILAGMTWAAADEHARIVNLSLGGEDDPAVVDPVEQAVQTLSDQYGTLFVVAAGNTDGGVVEGAIASPGSAAAALTVGAVDDKDALADFSRRGPTADGRLKPDITAPGIGITAARGKDATEVPGRPGDPYTTLSGTSMATPHVAGAAAILAQQHADWSGQRLKAALMASAKPNPAYGSYAQGAGRVDLARAITQSVTSAPSSVGFGEQSWPHQDDEVRSNDVTYHNDGPKDVILDLKLATVNPDGTPTPQGVFTVSPASVVVPAGGDAQATVTVDTRVPGPDGYLSGWLTGTAGDLAVRTPVAVTKEVESYDVTVTQLDRNGSAPWYYSTMLTKRDSDSVQFTWADQGPDNTATFRVPKGHYTLSSIVDTLLDGDPNGPGRPVVATNATLLAQADVYVDRPLTLTADARLGRPISVTVPRPSAQQVFAEVSDYTDRPQGSAGQSILSSSFTSLFTGRIGPNSSDDKFFSDVAGQWARADADGGTEDSPYLYSLYFPITGRMVNGYQRSVADRDLAQVRADFASGFPGEIGMKSVMTGSSTLGVGNIGPFLSFHLPSSRTEYYNTGPGIGSSGQYDGYSPDSGVAEWASSNSITSYQPGHSYHEQWNTGVFAPSFPPSSAPDAWHGVTRAGDYISLDIPMYSDGTGRAGSSDTTTSIATLFLNGTKIGSTDGSRLSTLTVPDGDGSYRLEMHTERDAPFVLSTRTDIAWTFRSRRGGSDDPISLPLWTVGFNPELDRYNAAPANGVDAVPLTVTPQPGAAVGTLTDITVEASLDDGATWKPLRLRGGAALVPHSGGSGFVSLRATAADSQGDTVELTVIHAYKYGRAAQ
jgi:subtilisin family serine protease